MSTNKSIVTLLAALLAGCATTDSSEFHRAADLVEARDNFQVRKEACRNAGKTAFIKADATRIKRERSDKYDYLFASCD